MSSFSGSNSPFCLTFLILKMKAVSILNVRTTQPTTQCHIPEDLNLQIGFVEVHVIYMIADHTQW